MKARKLLENATLGPADLRIVSQAFDQAWEQIKGRYQTNALVVEAARSLVLQEALNREIGLQLFYVPDLPPCKRIVTVDATGAIVPSVSSIPPTTAAAR